MELINTYYNNLRRKIPKAKTLRALKKLAKKNLVFYKKYSQSNIKLEIRRKIMNEYNKTDKLIEHKIYKLRK